MNINSIIRNGSYTNIGGCLKFSFQYNHKRLEGYDCMGRPKFHEVPMHQVVYGVTKAECKARARILLNIERYEQRHFIIYTRYEDRITDGLGVLL